MSPARSAVVREPHLRRMCNRSGSRGTSRVSPVLGGRGGGAVSGPGAALDHSAATAAGDVSSRTCMAASTPPPIVRDVGLAEAELDSGQRAEEHRVVEIAQMADAEDAVGDLGGARCRARCRNASACWRGRRRHCCPSGMTTAVSTPLSWPCRWQSTSRPQARTAARVAAPWRWCRAKDVLEPLFVEHGDGLVEAVEHVGAGGIGEIAGRVRPLHVVPVPVGPAHPACFSAIFIAFSLAALKPRPGGSISPFCDPETATFDAPFVEPEVDRGEARDSCRP